jgi:CDP-diacylglycerol--glycerol-3-phosphate 3-phosphatidyltransferase
VNQAVDKEPKTFTDTLRVVFKSVLDKTAALFLKLGLTPNMVTIIGLLGHFVAAFLVVKGYFTWAGLTLLFLAPFDAVDGAMARMKGEIRPFGAFFDSVIDRYSELVIFGGLLTYFVMAQNWLACLGVYLAASGSIMVSYTRARAQSLGFEAKIGLLSRVERYIVLLPGLIFNIPLISIWIIAVLANITAIQRIVHVNKSAILPEKDQD